MSASPKNNAQDSVQHSDPIPITSAHSRHRSASVTSSDSSGSPSSPPMPQTPMSAGRTSPRTVPANISPTSSPILSYFMGQSPAKTTTGTYPFSRKFGGAPPVFEEEEHDTFEPPVAAHARRSSTAGRFGQQQPTPTVQDPSDRGTGLLRRLSLSTAFAKPPNGPTERNGIPSPPRPATPPNTAVSPGGFGTKLPNVTPRGTRTRRSATLSVDAGGRPRREPSPMGERILKGHFDGFN